MGFSFSADERFNVASECSIKILRDRTGEERG
jgi:hypothetical protein